MIRFIYIRDKGNSSAIIFKILQAIGTSGFRKRQGGQFVYNWCTWRRLSHSVD